MAWMGLAMPEPGLAQSRPMTAVGYVADAPDMLAGVAAWSLVPGLGGWGLYIDGKLDTADPTEEPGYEPDLTAEEVESQFPNDGIFKGDERWWGVNLAVLREVGPELMLYAGAGYAHHTNYLQYRDPQQERGVSGFYWVEDEEATGSEINLLAGVLLRIAPHVRLQFGAEAQPKGFTVGASLNWPGR